MVTVGGAEFYGLSAGEPQLHAKTALSAANGKGSAQNNGHAVARDLESQQVEGAAHGMVLPFMQVTVTFRDVRYFVPAPEVSNWVLLRLSLRRITLGKRTGR